MSKLILTPREAAAYGFNGVTGKTRMQLGTRKVRAPAGLIPLRASLSIDIPVRTVSEANQREYWAVKLRRKKAQQVAVQAAFIAGMYRSSQFCNCEITLLRYGPKRLDSDNLAGSFKYVQDAVSEWIAVDDGDERLAWTYSQVKSPLYGVRVTIQWE